MLKQHKAVVVFCILFALGLPSWSLSGQEDTPAKVNSPHIMLWAWERPEHMTFADDKKIGIAFLAQRFVVKHRSANKWQVMTIPRTQTLALKPGTYLTAVFRIDIAPDEIGLLTPDVKEKIAGSIIEYALTNRHKIPAVHEIQIDFDARLSERDFYTDLLKDLRTSLPTDLKLSMTALASWCLGDYWLANLPVDEVVPMLFSMGRDGKRIKFEIARHKGFIGQKCQCAVGLSSESVLEHQFTELVPRRRIYIFNRTAWTEESAKRVIVQIEEGAKLSDDKKE